MQYYLQIFIDYSRFEQIQPKHKPKTLYLDFYILSFIRSFGHLSSERKFAICSASCGYHEIFTKWYFNSEQIPIFIGRINSNFFFSRLVFFFVWKFARCHFICSFFCYFEHFKRSKLKTACRLVFDECWNHISFSDLMLLASYCT